MDSAIGIGLAALAVVAFVGLQKSATTAHKWTIDPDAPPGLTDLSDVASVLKTGGTIAVQLLDTATKTPLAANLTLPAGTKADPKDGRFPARYAGPTNAMVKPPFEPPAGAIFRVGAKDVLKIVSTLGGGPIGTAPVPHVTGIPDLGPEFTAIDTVDTAAGRYVATAAMSKDGKAVELSEIAPDGDFNALELAIVGPTAFQGVIVAQRAGAIKTAPLDLKTIEGGVFKGALDAMDLSCAAIDQSPNEIRVQCGGSHFVVRAGVDLPESTTDVITSLFWGEDSHPYGADVSGTTAPNAEFDLGRYAEEILGVAPLAGESAG